jgi:hypothetical protein
MQALPISLATTLGISVDFCSSAYLDVSVQQVRRSKPMDSAWATPPYMALLYPCITRLAWSGFCAHIKTRAHNAPGHESHLWRGGFPHSDICGSKLVCQLPAAFRRLPRPSSPVIAKASTTCTYSLDPITLSAPKKLQSSKLTGLTSALGCAHRPPFVSSNAHDTIIKPSRSNPRFAKGTETLYFFRIFKEQPHLQNIAASVPLPKAA